MVIWIWVNIGSGNGLVPDGTKPLPEPKLTNHQWGSVACTWEQFYRKCWRIQSVALNRKLYSNFEITSTSPRGKKLLPHFPGVKNYSHISQGLKITPTSPSGKKNYFHISQRSKLLPHLPGVKITSTSPRSQKLLPHLPGIKNYFHIS